MCHVSRDLASVPNFNVMTQNHIQALIPGWFASPFSLIWQRLSGIGVTADDSGEVRTLKAISNVAHVLAAINAAYFSAVYLGMGRVELSVSLFVFGMLMTGNLVAFAWHRKLVITQNIAFFAIYLHIVTYHVLLGGYVGSSGYIHYGAVVMVALHLFYQRNPFLWFFMYLITAITLFAFEPIFSARVTQLPESFRSLALFNDYVIISCIVFFAVRRFAKQLRKERATIRDAYDELESSYEKLGAAQGQLVQSEKMASLGRLSSGLAHEIRNPVNFVNNFAEANKFLLTELRQKFQEEPEVALSDVMDIVDDLSTNIDRIESHGKRADVIVSNMVHHVSGNAGERRSVKPNGLVEDSLNIALHAYRAEHAGFEVDIARELAEDLPLVSVATQDMAKAFINLFDNAFDASANRESNDEPTQITIRSSMDTLHERRAVRIEIADNGNGVPDEICDRIFEPFFTTQPGHKGTGLGLSLSYDIVVGGHNGTLELVESDAGACFAVTLPVAD